MTTHEWSYYILCSGDTRVTVPKEAFEEQSGYVRCMTSFIECANQAAEEKHNYTSNCQTEHINTYHTETERTKILQCEMKHRELWRETTPSETSNHETQQSETYKRETEQGEPSNHETENIETWKHEIKLDNLSGDVLHIVGDYVRNDDVTLNRDNVIHVMIGADFLDMPSLVNKCETFVTSHLTIYNYKHVMEIAMEYNLPNLSELCVNFIVSILYTLPKGEQISLSEEQLKRCLADERLYNSEFRLLDIVKTWLKHNKGIQVKDYDKDIDVDNDGWKTFADFMSEILWPLIPRKHMKKLDSGIKHAMKKIPRCRELLKAAKEHHCINNERGFMKKKYKLVRSEVLCLFILA